MSWWLHPVNILKGRSLQHVSIAKTIFTDASKQGWGGMLGNQVTQWKLSLLEKEKHINWLELEAVILTVKTFLPQLRDQAVLVRSDSTSVVQYIVKEGGPRSPQLC